MSEKKSRSFKKKRKSANQSSQKFKNKITSQSLDLKPKSSNELTLASIHPI